MTDNYSENLKEALQKSKRIARKRNHETYGPAHILYALLSDDTGINPMLDAMDKDVDYIKEWADMRLEAYPKSIATFDGLLPDVDSDRVLAESVRTKLVLGSDFVDPFCVFLTLITPGNAYSSSQLKSIGVTPQEFLTVFESGITASRIEDPTIPLANGNVGGNRLTIPYCSEYKPHDETLSKNEIIGRDKEVRLIQEALLRYFNVGILVVGDAGVGKTALIRAFVLHLMERKQKFEVWEKFRILKCNVIKLMSGSQGPIESMTRLQKVFDSIRKLDGRVLLVMDDLHLLLSDNDASNNGLLGLIGSELEDSSACIIATSSVDSYRKTIEKQSSLLGRMEIIQLEELSKVDTLRCLQNYSSVFHSHHKVAIHDDALKESIVLSQRYFKERKLPFSAIELIDRTLSAVKVCNEQSKHEISNISKLFEELRAGIDEGKYDDKEDDLFDQLRLIFTLVQKRISPVLLGQLTDETNAKDLADAELMQDYLEKTLGELWELTNQKIEEVSPVEVAAIVAHITGIPIGKVQAQEKDKLLNIASYLRRRVVGQEQAIHSLSEAIIESRSGLNKAGQPIGSFFFLGPTGTGKTEFAKTIAEFLFDDEKAMIRFDMSEFKEEHSAALLYGAPPGYVGYQEGGLLVNKIRQTPYSVVLFDEIEKAHSSVYDVFLQIMDEGHIHDKLGREGDFSNSIIIFTSNIGSEWVAEQFKKGVVPEPKGLIEIMSSSFRPEFLGRLTEIVPFGPISEDVVDMIFDIQMKDLESVLERRKITLELSDTAKKKLSKMGYSEKYGARPVASVIRSEIRKPIARKLVSGELDNGMTIQMDFDDETGVLWNIKPEKIEI